MFCPTKNLHFLSIHGGVDRVLPVCPAVNKKKKMSSSNLQVAEFAIPLLICSGVHLGGGYQERMTLLLHSLDGLLTVASVFLVNKLWSHPTLFLIVFWSSDSSEMKNGNSATLASSLNVPARTDSPVSGKNLWPWTQKWSKHSRVVVSYKDHLLDLRKSFYPSSIIWRL